MISLEPKRMMVISMYARRDRFHPKRWLYGMHAKYNHHTWEDIEGCQPPTMKKLDNIPIELLEISIVPDGLPLILSFYKNGESYWQPIRGVRVYQNTSDEEYYIYFPIKKGE